MKCDQCQDVAEVNFTYSSSRGVQSVNLCGCCGAMLWSKFGTTEALQSAILGEPKEKQEKSA